jgi:hypothetical protein
VVLQTVSPSGLLGEAINAVEDAQIRVGDWLRGKVE